MTDDPNADLIGQEITVEGQVFIVTGSAPWNPTYLLAENEDERQTMAVAAYVRASLR